MWVVVNPCMTGTIFRFSWNKGERQHLSWNATLDLLVTWHRTRGQVYSPLVASPLSFSTHNPIIFCCSAWLMHWMWAHQQNISLLFGTCGLLDHLGSNPSKFKRVPKNHTIFSCYLVTTCTSEIFLFKLGLLTFYLLFSPFLAWFWVNILKRKHKWVQVIPSSHLNKNQATRMSKKIIIK